MGHQKKKLHLPREVQDDPKAARAVLSILLQDNHVTSQQVQQALAKYQEQTKKSRDTTKASKTAATTTTHRYRHVALQIYYEGTPYTGLAENMGHPTDQSIEKHLFAALTKTRLVENRSTCHYSRAGRTDKGVSAAGQVVALYLKSQFAPNATWDAQGTQLLQEDDLPKQSHTSLTVWVPPKKKKKKNKPDEEDNIDRQCVALQEYDYPRILNNLLPPTIRVLAWAAVTPDFSARFSATTRTYRYFFVAQNYNVTAMQQGLDLLVGTHDFRNFCKMDVEKVSNFVRTIHKADIVVDNVSYFEIVGQAFLWHQIRCIVHVLFLIGQGFEEPSIVTHLLNVQQMPGKPSYPLADEAPLVLHDCGYPCLTSWGHSVANLWTLTAQWQTEYQDKLLEAARIRNGLGKLEQDSVQVLRQDVMDFAQKKHQERQKKQSKHNGQATMYAKQDKLLQTGPPGEADLISWHTDAIPWLQALELDPTPQRLIMSVHIPLLERSQGTTYEEKVDSLKKNPKRSQKYQENIVKKRKSAEEDNAFYEHMTKQGGSGI